MGMARKAPAPIYEQHFYVSQHAVERFRGRNLKDAYRHRFGDDLSRLIDWACWEALQQGHIEHLHDEAGDFDLLNLHPILEEPLWAILKPNLAGPGPRRSDRPDTIVTLLEDYMVQQKRQRQWQDRQGRRPVDEARTVATPLGAKLREALENQTLPPERPFIDDEPVLAVAPEPVLPAAPPPMVAAAAAPERLVSWRNGTPELQFRAFTSVAEALTFMAEQRNHPACHEVMVWKPAKVRIVIEEDE